MMRETNRAHAQKLREMLNLRFEPIAVKLIEREEDVPEGALRPRRDLGKHMALCQAFALTRRERKTLYLDKYDQWCWNPLIGLGLVDCGEETESFEVVCKYLGIADPDAARDFFAKFPRLPLGQYIGTVTAPLSDAGFEPDLTLIYANNAQLRSMVWAIKGVTGKLVHTELDAIDSCIYACVPPVLTGEYRVTLPDIGEYERAAAGEDEVILSVPKGRLSELVSGLQVFEDRHMGYRHLAIGMEYDFARPPFYNELYALWGLDQGEDWGR